MKHLFRRLSRGGHRLAAADQIARQKTPVNDDIAYFVKTDDGVAQSGDVGARRNRFFPAAVLQIIDRDVAAVFERLRNQILESAAPQRHVQMIVDKVWQFLHLDTGDLASRANAAVIQGL